MKKRPLNVQRVNLFFTQRQIEELDAEARRRTLSRASLVRGLVQTFLESVQEKKENACHT